ncbi:MAG TPA: HPr family phosphocarrier protein [Gammaproteobacteria bacterium]|nr:HPr family phosphocarrier protein [Gammaproteobacteria bacterium]
MLEKQVKIINKLGLHARAAAKFVTLASKFDCDVFLQKDARKINGKSIMGVMMLAASQGTELTLSTSGNDEGKAAEELNTLIEDRFGENE